MNTRLCMLGVLLAAVACGKGNEGNGPAPSASPQVAAVTATPSASAKSQPRAARPLAWRGAYESVAGELTIPESLKAGKWANADSSAALGEGTLGVTVDPVTNRVSGTLDGPLGPASISGLFVEGKITATIRRNDPADQGFAGTLEGSVADGALSGTMSGALGQATAVRAATFSLSSIAGGDAGEP